MGKKGDKNKKMEITEKEREKLRELQIESLKEIVVKANKISSSGKSEEKLG